MLTVLRSSQRNWVSECRTATGRSAVQHLINILKPKAVLMPSYVPEGILVPFVRSGTPIKYYKLREDLRPDLDHLQKNLCKGSLVIVIHYFGYITETGALREIVSNVDGVLFEDCAQALFAKAADADVALWSYNKFLPVVDGAVLRSRRRGINVTNPSYVEAYLPPKVANDYHQHLDLNSRILKITDPEQALDAENESKLAYENYYGFINSDLSLYAQSPESKCIIADTDLAEVRKIRSHNAQSYYKITPECFIFRRPVPAAPFAYVIVVRPPLICENVFDALLNVGVLPSRLIEKWDHVPKGDPRFIIEHTFMDQHLLLPVGEEVTYDAIRRVGAVLKRFGEWESRS